VEAKKLVVGTAYATCDGHCVVPMDLKKRYRWKWDPTKKKDVLIELGPDGRVDPWSDCHVTRDGGRGRGARGLKCMRYDVDRDGKQVGKGVVAVVAPRDIRGTWSDYVLLYAHAIQQNADRRIAEDKVRKIAQEAMERLKTITPQAVVSGYTRQNYDTGKYWGEFHVHLGTKVSETQLANLLKKLGV
jgi:hypothetical protein